MKIYEQKKLFRLEFASWANRFFRHLTIFIIALMGIVLAQSFFSIGGVDAQYLIYTFGLLSMAIGAQFLVFWARIGGGFGISKLTLLFVPWLILLGVDAFGLSGTPWRAEYILCLNLLPVMAYFVAVRTARTKKNRWWLIAIVSTLVLVSGLFDFLRPEIEESIANTGGGTLGQLIRIIFGAFGNTASVGAAMLLAFFAMVFLVVSGHFKMWVRLFGLYTSVLFLLGIAFTRHVGVYWGLIAGVALSVQLLVRRRSVRWVLFLFLGGCAVLAYFNSNTNVGCLTTVESSPQIRAAFSPEERREGVNYLLAHAAIEMFKEHPIWGVGSGMFREEFEKYRTPQWQTDPRTAGSLYLDVLAENGIVGLLLLGAPLIYLLYRGVSTCHGLPWQSDTERAALRRKMGILDLGSLPEERIALAGTLSGLVAVGVLLGIDYPRNLPGVVIACAIFGGIATYLMSGKRHLLVQPNGIRRHIWLIIAFVFPVVLMWAFLPILRAESEYQKGMKELAPFRISLASGQSVREGQDPRALDEAEAHLRAAIRKNPNHGDAWAALAAKYAFHCHYDPMRTDEIGKYIRISSRNALKCSTTVPRFYQMHAVAELVAGNYEAVRADLAFADNVTRNNAGALLLSAEILRTFPEGVNDAARYLDQVAALKPGSSYVDNLRALMSLGKKDSKSEEHENGESDRIAIPEF